MQKANKLLFDSSTIITLLDWQDEHGFPRFCFYAANGKNMKNLPRILQNGGHELKKYGHIIRQGYGEPEADDWQFMKDTYDIEKDKIVVAELPK